MTLDRIIQFDGMPVRESDLNRTPPYRIHPDILVAYALVLTKLEGKNTLSRNKVISIIPFLKERRLKKGIWSTQPEFNVNRLYEGFCEVPRGYRCPAIDESFSYNVELGNLGNRYSEKCFITPKGVHYSLDEISKFQKRSPPAAAALYTALQEYKVKR